MIVGLLVAALAILQRRIRTIADARSGKHAQMLPTATRQRKYSIQPTHTHTSIDAEQKLRYARKTPEPERVTLNLLA